MKYCIIKKSNGKFAPRIINDFTGKDGCWFEAPYEYDTLKEALGILKFKKEYNDKEILKQKEEIVFTLE